MLTVAVYCWVMFRGISALFGESEMVIAGTTTEAVLKAAVLVIEVAVTVTFKSLAGAAGGAV